MIVVVVVAIRLNKSDTEKKKQIPKPDVVVRLSELAPEHPEAVLNHAKPASELSH